MTRWRETRARRLLKDVTVAALQPSRSAIGRAVDKVSGGAISRSSKWYIRRGLSVEAFFGELQRRKIRSVVLRWFQTLPQVEPGHDIDLLVADADIDRVEDLLSCWPGGQRIDVYTETGDGGWGYMPDTPREMAVFPPFLASEILRDARTVDGIYPVPSLRHAFLCLAYHVTYLKAQHSGLRSQYVGLPKGKPPTHDYATVLPEMAAQAGIGLPLDPSLEQLDAVLADHGWRPPRDLLERISVWSPWAKRHFFMADAAPSAAPGLSVFFVRDHAVTNGFADTIRHVLQGHGFEILAERMLDDEAQAEIAAQHRGGNWGRGPNATSGGPPRLILAAVDVFPLRVPGAMRNAQPLLDNARILEAKQSVRTQVNRANRGPRFNALHSTDHAGQAIETLRAIFPERLPAILAEAEAAHDAVRCDPPPEQILPGQSRRARVERITRNGRPAVRKVFRRNRTDFLKREVAALSALADTGQVPALLEQDARSFLMERIEDDWAGRPPCPLSRDQTRQLRAFVDICAARGLDPIDLMPGKNLVCRGGRLVVLDFEFCHDHGKPIAPERLYCLTGVPDGFDGPLPLDTPSIRAPYSAQWARYTAMPLDVFLCDDPGRQLRSRLVAVPLSLLRGAVKKGVGRTRAGRRLATFLRRARS